MMSNSQTLLSIFDQATLAYKIHGGLTLAERVHCLKTIKSCLLENQQLIIEAINTDFGCRSSHESMMAEVITSLAMIDHAVNNLKRWAKPRNCKIPLMYQPAKAKIYPQEKGVVGIICPWNYPVQLVISPLVCAIAAGNRVILKLSEKAPRTADLLLQLFKDQNFSSVIWAVTGDSGVAEQFSRLPFNHIFFTGSSETGKKVMLAAAPNLTPVTLELGGKSPAILAKDAISEQIVERVINGKLFNAGQTCVAPDFVWIPEVSLEQFVEFYQSVIKQFYPNDNASQNITSIIDQQNYTRLKTMVAQAKAANCRIVESEVQWKLAHPRCFKPVLIINPDEHLAVMNQELFGPVLVIKTYTEYHHIFTYHLDKPLPLAVYLFSTDKFLIDRFIKSMRCGSLSVNETLIHAAIPTLPLGGLGSSGLGQYHGRSGFDAFSHLKPVFTRKKPNFSRYFQPPYEKTAELIIKFLLKKLS